MAFVFDPEVIHQVVREALAYRDRSGLGVTIELIASGLETRYPGRIQQSRHWVFSNAGGTMGQFTILHASLTEYLIVFGTPIGTEGHSGRFMSEDYFYVLEGEQWAYSEGQLEKHVYRPGDCHVLPRGKAEGWCMPDRAYALEYARGVIPAMMPFGLADAFTSTLDARTIAKTFALYGDAVVRQLLRGKV